MNYKTKEVLESELQDVQDFIEDQHSCEFPELMKSKLVSCNAYLATSVVLVASSKFHLLQVKNLKFRDAELQNLLCKMPASLQKELIDSYCSTELANYELAQRQNACIVHQIDALRSLLSFAKTEIERGGVR